MLKFGPIRNRRVREGGHASFQLAQDNPDERAIKRVNFLIGAGCVCGQIGENSLKGLFGGGNVADATIVASELGHACLGLEALGLCSYDPAKPFTIYFAPGAAVGALAFTLAVQQLLKPVYRFRLEARHLSISRIYICVFCGVAAVVVASSSMQRAAAEASGIGR